LFVCGFVCLALPVEQFTIRTHAVLVAAAIAVASLFLLLLLLQLFGNENENKCTLRGEVLSSVNWPQLFDMPASSGTIGYS